MQDGESITVIESCHDDLSRERRIDGTAQLGSVRFRPTWLDSTRRGPLRSISMEGFKHVKFPEIKFAVETLFKGSSDAESCTIVEALSCSSLSQVRCLLKVETT